MVSMVVFIWFLGWLISCGTVLDDVEDEPTWYIFTSTLGLVLVWPIWLGKVLRG